MLASVCPRVVQSAHAPVVHCAVFKGRVTSRYCPPSVKAFVHVRSVNLRLREVQLVFFQSLYASIITLQQKLKMPKRKRPAAPAPTAPSSDSSGLSRDEAEYVVAWKWLATRRAGLTVLLPPVILPAFDVVRLDGEHVTVLKTVALETSGARNATVDAYRSLRSPTFLYQGDNPDASDRRAREVTKGFEVLLPAVPGHALGADIGRMCGDDVCWSPAAHCVSQESSRVQVAVRLQVLALAELATEKLLRVRSGRVFRAGFAIAEWRSLINDPGSW